VACYLEALGHTVIVADPNYAPMYTTHVRRRPTDVARAYSVRHADSEPTAGSIGSLMPAATSPRN